MAGYLGKTRKQLLRELDAEELLDWALLEQLEPWGQKRLDWHYARLMACVYTAMGVRKEDKTAYEGKDFVIEFEDPWPVEPEDEQKLKSQTIDYQARAISEWVHLHNQQWAARQNQIAAIEGRKARE